MPDRIVTLRGARSPEHFRVLRNDGRKSKIKSLLDNSVWVVLTDRLEPAS